MIVIGAFIDQIHLFGDNAKAMGEPWWYPELVMVFIAQYGAVPAAERRRFPSDIQGHIKNGAGNNVDELALGVVLLKMKAAEYSLAGSRVVILHELQADSLILEAAPAKRLEEEPAFVCKYSRLDEQQVGYGCFGDFHGEFFRTRILRINAD